MHPIKVEPRYVEAQGPPLSTGVSFVGIDPGDWKLPQDNQRVSSSVFQRSPIIKVVGLLPFQHMPLFQHQRLLPPFLQEIELNQIAINVSSLQLLFSASKLKTMVNGNALSETKDFPVRIPMYSTWQLSIWMTGIQLPNSLAHDDYQTLSAPAMRIGSSSRLFQQ